MKKLILTSILLFQFGLVVWADYGSCVVYYAKFYLKDGREFRGCVERSGYDVDLDVHNNDRYCSDTGMISLIKKIYEQTNPFTKNGEDRNYKGKITIFKDIRYLSPRPLHRNKDDEKPMYGFVTADDIVYIHPSEIKHIVFWSAEYSKRHWVTSELIVGNAEMIDTVEQRRYWNSVQMNNRMEVAEDGSDDWGYRLLNYNAQINKPELRRLAALKFKMLESKQLEKDLRKKYHLKYDPRRYWTYQQKWEDFQQAQYQELRMWFWQRKILVVEINGTC
jgi:hypothetical protein